MSRSIRRGAVAATLALALAPLAAACSSGTDAATTQLKPDSAYTQVGTIKVQNLSLVPGDKDSGLVALGGALINESDQPETLKQVTLAGSTAPGAMKDKDGAASITIPARGAVYLTGEKGGPSVTFSGIREDITGKYVDVAFSFGTVGQTKLGVAVHPAEGYYAPLKPSSPPSTPPSTPVTVPTVTAPPTSTPPSGPPVSPPASGAPATGQAGGPTATGTATAQATNSSSRPPASNEPASS
ncbi:hypothetical protein [Streptodolium elevatio]